MSSRLAVLGALVAVTALGAVVRAIPLAVSDFPVNDGGLFLAMTHAIRDAGWALPESLAWNGDTLPFAYPPLAFYAAGLLESAGFDPFDVFRWLPLAASILVVPAVYLLGRDLLRSELGGLVAALAYALTPVSFVWLIQGGGVTRAPGLLFAVLTLWQVVGLVREPVRGRVLATGVLAGLTAVTHPGAAIFTAVSAILIGVFEGRTRAAATAAAGSLGIALLVAAPWLVAIASRGQLGDLVAVPSNGPDPLAAVLAVFAGRVTGAPFIDPLAIIGLAFALLSLVRRRLLLPLWFGVSVLLSYQYAMVPFGLLIGSAAMDLAAIRARGSDRRLVPLIGAGVLAAALVVEGVAGATTILQPDAPVHALDANRRDAMDWMAELPSDARIAVITGSE
ncbi:MAG TPA: glycosyltransferase family 39 protein, partial [Candidatus Limnocylindria bacterium]